MEYGEEGVDPAGDEDYSPGADDGEGSEPEDKGPSPSSSRRPEMDEDEYVFPSDLEGDDEDGYPTEDTPKRKKPRPRKRAARDEEEDADEPGKRPKAKDKKPKPKPAAKGFGSRFGTTANRGVNPDDMGVPSGAPRPDSAATAVPLFKPPPPPPPVVKQQKKKPRLPFPERKTNSTFSLWARPTSNSRDIFDRRKHRDDVNPNSIYDEMNAAIASGADMHPTDLVNGLVEMHETNVEGEGGDRQAGVDMPGDIDPEAVEHTIFTRKIPLSAIKMIMIRGTFYQWAQSMKKSMFIGADGQPEPTDFALKVTAHTAAVLEKLNKLK